MSTLADIEFDISQELRAREVYEDLLPAILDLPRDQVMRVTAQVQLTMSIVLGFLPRIAALREQIAEQLPDFNLIHIDNLERLALALSHAQAQRTEAVHPTEALLCLKPEALRVRRLLLAAVRSLISRDLIARTALCKYSGRPGFEYLSEDLGLLTAILVSSWQQLQRSSQVDRSELDHALALDKDIRRLLAMRQLWVRGFHTPDDIIARAFTLLMRSYNQVRRAVHPLPTARPARHGHAQPLVPSQDRPPRPPTPPRNLRAGFRPTLDPHKNLLAGFRLTPTPHKNLLGGFRPGHGPARKPPGSFRPVHHPARKPPGRISPAPRPARKPPRRISPDPRPHPETSWEDFARPSTPPRNLLGGFRPTLEPAQKPPWSFLASLRPGGALRQEPSGRPSGPS